MILTSSKKMACIYAAGIFILLLLSFSSCRKEYSTESNNRASSLPDFSVTINSSVAGFVTDENNAIVAGATVKAGAATTTTDKFGYFEIRNAKLIKNAGIVTISKPGYFKGIKSFVAAENKKAFFRIQLIPKIMTGSIESGAGGTVTLPNGLSVSLPAYAVINEHSKTPYTGTVTISSYWINPVGDDLNKIMPGDLRGITSEGKMKILATYGMAAIELTGTSGELLQIATGKKASLSFPVPSTIAGGAPAIIPLWYFDETTGVWKEEGTATKKGNTYVGEVSHFSYWNCDIPFANAVNFSCTIADATGHPLPNVGVTVFFSSNNEYTGCHGLTDSSGYISGAIPADAQLIIQVYGSSNCAGNVAYTNTFTTTNTNIALGTIILPNDRTVVLTGNVINCANTAVTNGYVMFTKDDQSYRYTLNENGSFSMPLLLCGVDPVVTMIAVDKDGLQQSSIVSLTLTNGTNVGTLKACGTSTAQFINYSIDGALFSFADPTDQFYHFATDSSTLASDYVSGYGVSNNITNAVNISFTHTGIAVNSKQKLIQFSTSFATDSLYTTNPVAVKITEYSIVGEFIAGSFSGTLTGMPPAKLPHTVTCTFRVKRER